MNKSIIAVSVMLAAFSMNAMANDTGADKGEFAGYSPLNYYFAMGWSDSKKDIELLGFVPQECKLEYRAERPLMFHNSATFVDMTKTGNQKVGHITTKCNIPNTTVTVRSPSGQFINNRDSGKAVNYKHSFSNTGFMPAKWPIYKKATDYNNIETPLYIQIPEMPDAHGVYKASFNVLALATF